MMDKSQFYKGKKKKKMTKTSVQKKNKNLRFLKNFLKKIPHTTTHGTKLMVQQVTSCSLMAAPNMASSYFIPITIKIRTVP